MAPIKVHFNIPKLYTIIPVFFQIYNTFPRFEIKKAWLIIIAMKPIFFLPFLTKQIFYFHVCKNTVCI